ncbi:MAG: hypothetical protein WC635_04730 [Bacteriovorax sp.]|jgi:hypothetical protein
MKSLIAIIALTCAFSAMAATSPRCVNIGSKSEGWKTTDGKLLWAQCSKEALVCDKDAWVSYNLDLENMRLLGWSQCSKSAANKPVCANVGSRSEGWKMNGKLIWDNCSDKAVICGAKGSRSEGWYAADLELSTRRVIEKANCAKK